MFKPVRWAPAAAAIIVVLSSGCSPPQLLVVDLLTNYRLGFEFDRAEVALYRGETASALSRPFLVTPARAFDDNEDERTGLRVAEISGLEARAMIVQVRLLRGAELVASELVVVDYKDSSQSVTVRVTRECADVECPGSGSPSEIACLAGRCVDPRCSPESPEHCPTDPCEHDAQCDPPGSTIACEVGACLGGACARWLDDSQCTGEQSCLPETGCTDPGGLDAGVADAGVADAGVADAGLDAGVSSAVTQITGGLAHTCAKHTAGELHCWGTNIHGQLGDGTRMDGTVAVDLPSGTAQVSAGDHHTCALTRSGRVLCWGLNVWGQLGDGTKEERLLPTGVAGVSDAEEVRAGKTLSCARRATGEVLCWGNNMNGQLGDGTRSEHLTPAAVSGLTDAAQLAVGERHACALRATGGVVCWGANTLGELGDGTVDDRLVPVPVAGLTDAVEVTANSRHTCARRESGQVTCWGNGQPLPADLPGLDNAVRVSAGAVHACAITAEGAVVCVGTNLTQSLAQRRTRPHPIALPGPAVEITSGNLFECALTARAEVLCWGTGASPDGRLEPFTNAMPAAVVDLTDAVSLAAAGTHSCAVRASGQQVCWGRTGPEEAYGIPTEAPLLAGVTRYGAFSDAACWLRSTGVVMCAGRNQWGQLGDGTTTDRAMPEAVPGITNATDVVMSSERTCVLLADRTISCWGSFVPANRGRAAIPGVDLAVGISLGGELCAVLTTGSVLCGDATLTPVEGVTDAVQVGTGSASSCALRRGGGVWCWGENASGQLGDGTTSARVNRVPVTGLSDAVGLTVGQQHACALRASGEVVCWGADPTTGAVRTTPTLVPDLTDAVELVGGHNHNCARLADGSVVCWGDNREGQLGRRPLWIPISGL